MFMSVNYEKYMYIVQGIPFLRVLCKVCLVQSTDYKSLLVMLTVLAFPLDIHL